MTVFLLFLLGKWWCSEYCIWLGYSYEYLFIMY